MVVAEVHYQQESAPSILLEALSATLLDTEKEPIFIFIGSDRHLLDCFGPLAGTMLSSLEPEMHIYGTLETPIHAQNLVKCINSARNAHADRIIVAVDASAGQDEEVGLIRIKKGGIVPGKALAKNLPTVGQLAITGVVDTRLSLRGVRTHRNQGLALVYGMADVLSKVISEWHRNQNPVTERRI